MHDPYEDQRAAARYRAERDQAREELARIMEDRSWDSRADAGMLGAKEDRRAVEWVREHGGLESVEARLMPEGMEWPRYEGGGPVGIGSETDVLRVDEIRFGVGGTGGCTLYQVGPDGLNDRVQAVAAGGRVKRPDSWERLEEDASKQPYGYCVEHGLFIDPYDGGCTTPTNELFARDLVRRAKALTERGR